jgi:uncharacterized membrane protein YkvA (DUF1232 family)
MPNDKRPVIYDQNLNFFRNLVLQARLVWLLMRDPRVPLWLKTLPIGSLAYLVMPFDIVSDIFPVLGQLDDLVIAFAGLATFVSLCPPDVVEEHMASLTGRESTSNTPASKSDSRSDEEVIDGSYTESEPKQ